MGNFVQIECIGWGNAWQWVKPEPGFPSLDSDDEEDWGEYFPPKRDGPGDKKDTKEGNEKGTKRSKTTKRKLQHLTHSTNHITHIISYTSHSITKKS